MKLPLTLLAALPLLLPIPALGQDFTQLDPTLSYGARIAGGLNYKLSSDLVLSAEQELRFNSANLFEKSYTTVGAEYKITDFLKVGADYSFIVKNSETETKLRNRVEGFVTGSVRFGFFKLSLREKLQLTMKGDSTNTFQSPANALSLKSRLKLEYNAPGALDPYFSIETRHALNDVSTDGWTYLKNDDNGRYYWWITDPQYDFRYMNRIRTTIGTDWKVAKRQNLNLYLLCDYDYSRQIDTNREGRVKRSAGLTVQPSWTFALGVAYTFTIKR